MDKLHILIPIIILAPLVGSIMAGVFRHQLGARGAHAVTITGISLSFITSMVVAKSFVFGNAEAVDIVFYQWVASGAFNFHVGVLVDHLSSMMLMFVTFVSLMVHIYSMGYMQKDPGYQRFFSYVSLFTFAMLVLVLSDNLMLLFFGWEGVGLVSYLLIGFWFNRPSAVAGSLKAFLVNRVGDVGFLLGIAMILMYFGTLNYESIFPNVTAVQNLTIEVIPGFHWNVATLMCLLLLIGAMGKSAQVPLHVWLPESMEGPTPISALIHAATMVTAGIYLISRMSPLFELSATALSVVLVVGATTCLFMGILGVFQYDIKRVIAYSTLSQLGYMIAACGASAFSAGMFHLFTHACFKALLFLAAGSVIIGMHHEQDMRKMGGLRKYMPITYVTFLIGALSLAAIPPFSGFYSKDSIIQLVGESTIAGSNYAYFCVVAGAFVTALYTFRAFFLTFHTRERMDEDTRRHLKESPWSVTIPLIILAVPSAILGYFMMKPMLINDPTVLGASIVVSKHLDVIAQWREHFEGLIPMIVESFHSLPCWLALGGIFVAWIMCAKNPEWSESLKKRFSFAHMIMLKKYGFDDFNDLVLVRGTLGLARILFQQGDTRIIDGWVVNGIGRLINWFSFVTRKLQTGYLYHYAFSMVIGLLVFLGWLTVGL